MRIRGLLTAAIIGVVLAFGSLSEFAGGAAAVTPTPPPPTPTAPPATPTPAPTATPVAGYAVSIDSATVAPGRFVSVLLRAHLPSPGIRAFAIDVTYDPQLLTAFGCTVIFPPNPVWPGDPIYPPTPIFPNGPQFPTYPGDPVYPAGPVFPGGPIYPPVPVFQANRLWPPTPVYPPQPVLPTGDCKPLNVSTVRFAGLTHTSLAGDVVLGSVLFLAGPTTGPSALSLSVQQFEDPNGGSISPAVSSGAAVTIAPPVGGFVDLVAGSPEGGLLGLSEQMLAGMIALAAAVVAAGGLRIVRKRRVNRD
jgi:hypothetical protein